MTVNPTANYPESHPPLPGDVFPLTHRTLHAIHDSIRTTRGSTVEFETSRQTRKRMLDECAEHLRKNHRIGLHTHDMSLLADVSLATYSHIWNALDAFEAEGTKSRVNRFDPQKIMTGISLHTRRFRSGKATPGLPIWVEEQAEIRRQNGNLSTEIVVPGPIPVSQPPGETPTMRRGDAYAEYALATELMIAAAENDAPVAERAFKIGIAVMGKNLPPLQR